LNDSHIGSEIQKPRNYRDCPATEVKSVFPRNSATICEKSETIAEIGIESVQLCRFERSARSCLNCPESCVTIADILYIATASTFASRYDELSSSKPNSLYRAENLPLLLQSFRLSDGRDFRSHGDYIHTKSWQFATKQCHLKRLWQTVNFLCECNLLKWMPLFEVKSMNIWNIHPESHTQPITHSCDAPERKATNKNCSHQKIAILKTTV
jgi:hypothetical protein